MALVFPNLQPRTPIFLIGYRGSGKSTVARLLAESLGWPWVDADDLLERRLGKSIRVVFAEDGEDGFREFEAALLEELVRLPGHVVATGGGVIQREANRERLRQAGRVVWLTADVQTLWQRLEGDPTCAERRPALTSQAKEGKTLAANSLAEITEVMRLREPLYRACAHATVETSGRTPEAVVAEILEQLAIRSR